MAKRGSGLAKLLIVGAAAAGAYYYIKKKNSEIPANMEDDDDLDNFYDEEETVKPEKGKRSYVSLDFNTVEKKVTDAVNKFAGSAEQAANTIGEKLKTTAGKVEDFFDDRKADAEEFAEETAETIKEKFAENSEDDYEENNSQE